MGVKIDWSVGFYDNWVQRYPEFDLVLEPVAHQYFDESGLYHAHDGSGPVADEGQQNQLIYMVMAHIAARRAIINGVQPSPLVGRISSAAEGSINVAVDLNVPAGSAQWWVQTKYGFDYWNATAQYRQFQYRMGPQRFFGALYPGGSGRLWGGGI